MKYNLEQSHQSRSGMTDLRLKSDPFRCNFYHIKKSIKCIKSNLLITLNSKFTKLLKRKLVHFILFQ